MNNIEKQSELVAYIKTLDNVREVNQSEQAAKTLGSINRIVSYVSVAVIVILLLIAVFLISNTISVGITVRKDEIGIMKYIGATDSFVRAPFLLEGMILGLIGAGIPLIILYFCYNNVVTYVYTKFSVLLGVVDSSRLDRSTRHWFRWRWHWELELVLWEALLLQENT